MWIVDVTLNQFEFDFSPNTSTWGHNRISVKCYLIKSRKHKKLLKEIEVQLKKYYVTFRKSYAFKNVDFKLHYFSHQRHRKCSDSITLFFNLSAQVNLCWNQFRMSILKVQVFWRGQKNISSQYFWHCWVNVKTTGRFSQILWHFHNVLTLCTCLAWYLRQICSKKIW